MHRPQATSAVLAVALATGFLAAGPSAAHAAPACSAKSYGAAGNGTTNDTAALQRAITACAGGGNRPQLTDAQAASYTPQK